MASTDGRVDSRVANYAGFFEKDAHNESEAHQENRMENYTDVINGEIEILTIQVPHRQCHAQQG